MSEYRLLEGDALKILPTIADGSVQTCVTSPPYWGLRDYGNEGQLGLEATPEEYVANMVRLFREVRRVLRDDGTLWLNLGDSYSGSGKGPAGNLGAKHNERHLEHKTGGIVPEGLKPKDLVGIPWRVAFALQEDGWWLRSDIIWAKPNPMPESVTDRPTRAHEYLFLLTKSQHYHYDHEAIKEPLVQPGAIVSSGFGGYKKNGGDTYSGNKYDAGDLEGRNKRSVWTISTQSFKGAHFAVMPTTLADLCVRAGCPAGKTVLDPFMGAGTVGVVAARSACDFVGIELNPEYLGIARGRISGEAPLFSSEVAP